MAAAMRSVADSPSDAGRNLGEDLPQFGASHPLRTNSYRRLDLDLWQVKLVGDMPGLRWGSRGRGFKSRRPDSVRVSAGQRLAEALFS
jgi:hypothetical protein